MTFDHIALIVGIIALVVLFGSVFVFKFINNKLRNNNREAYQKFQAFNTKLDDLQFLPILWVVSGVGILIWLGTRIVISYA